MNILVTGGFGYIGSHVTLTLLQAEYKVVVLDNLSNSSHESPARVARIAGKAALILRGEIRDVTLLSDLLPEHRIDAVMHFAGLKAVGESVQQPLAYDDDNVAGSVQLFQAMQDAGVYRIVSSSSATAYEAAARMPISEATPPSGLMGEDPRGTPNGTGVRDYIPVVDLDQGHLCALKALDQLNGVDVWTLGTNRGTGVMDAVKAFERVSGQTVPYGAIPSRPGDIAKCWADPAKAQEALGWTAQRSIAEIMTDAWQSLSPHCYGVTADDMA